MNFLFLDSETTGLHADKHDIVQLACIPIIGGKRRDTFNEFCQPTNYATVEQGAIDVHGITVARMKTFQSSKVMLEKFISYLKSFGGIKFIISGFNVGFDKRFLSAWFLKHGKENEFFALFELHTHDAYTRAQQVKSKLGTPNLKLETLAKHIGVDINAHEALSDIAATIEVDKYIGGILNEDPYEIDEVEQEEFKTSTIFPEPAQLHLHSVYGMVESVPDIEEWTKWCVDNKVPAFSIVDHGSAVSLFGMTRLKNKDVTSIPGVGLNLKLDSYPDAIFTINAWAINNTGYYNLMKLSSLAFDDQIEIDKIVYPKISAEQIQQYSEGLVFGTSDAYSALGAQIEAGAESSAEHIFQEYLRIFGDKLFIEFNPLSINVKFSAKTGFQKIKKNALVPDGDLNKAYNQFLARMVDKYDLQDKCVPTCGAHFIEESDKLIQDCVARNAYESGKCYHESHHVKNGKQMFEGLKLHLGEWLSEEMYLKWINNTLSIAEQAKSISIKQEYVLPTIEIPDHIKAKTSDYNKQTYYLTVEKCIEHGRWNNSPEYVARFKKEIDVIMNNVKMNFLPYFLLYEDIGAFARSQGILQNIGRGSAGGCLLSYYLKIIHIDPIVEKLPFERFLSHARIRAESFPDIDADFGNRTPIIKYLEDKYGLGFAQMCTLQKMKTKYAIKNAMWALYGVNGEDPNVKRICELIPDSAQGIDEDHFLYGHTDKEGVYHPGIIETVPEVEQFFKQFPAVEQMVKKMIGLVRGWGRHASAFVVSTVDLASRVPTMKIFDKDMGYNVQVTQFDATMTEKSGLVKADILGVTTIDAVSECIDLIKKRTGVDYLEEDENGVALIYRLPEDSDVYADFYNKKTDSSFQFNTSLIKGYIQQFAPTSRAHLSDLTALCRPGALDAPFVNDEITLDDKVSAAQYYIDVRNKERRLSYLHEDLASCTTNGIFVYQEEVMKFLVDIAGYTLEESDQIRAAIAKKKHEVMMSSFARIRESAAKRGWTKEQADTVCDQVQAFARYSFNRSHSRCYAELGYITMYLKHHYPLEWWTAMLNNTKQEDKLRHYMSLLGSIVTPPSLENPSDKFAIVKDKIIARMSVLKTIGPASIEELVTKGPFTSLEDYIERVAHNKVNKGHFSAMVKGRAVDCFMDLSKPYGEAKLELLSKYKKMRKCTEFPEDVRSTDPLTVFLAEREINKCFNKNLLDEPLIRSLLEKLRVDLKYMGKRNVPYSLGLGGSALQILSGVKSAEAFIRRGIEHEVGMFVLFDGSEYRHGTSKKSGKKYNFVKVTLNDGVSVLDGSWWDRTKALGWPKNSVVLVRGTLREGWGGVPSITIKEMEIVR